MGQIGSKAVKPIRNYNIEQRTEKVLEKAKEVPKAAPRHKTTEKLLTDFARDHPDFLEKEAEKNEDLLERLKMMKIESSGSMPEIKSKSSSLPSQKKAVPDTEFGYFEPEDIPIGKTTIRKATEFISQHSSDPQKYTAKILAESNKLDIGQTEEVLKHFKVFNMYLPNLKKGPKGVLETLEGGHHIKAGESKEKLSSGTNES